MQPLFGSPLAIALTRSSYITSDGHAIPGVLAVCYNEIEKRGLDIEGLFRKSGSTAAANQLQIEFERCHDPFTVKIPQQISSHSLAGIFKRYLQLLPEPVIPIKYQKRFLEVYDDHLTKDILKKRLKDICKALPHEHLHLFQFLIRIVDRIQKNQNNQMTVESLAIIFAPTCVGIDPVAELMQSQTTASANNNSTSRLGKSPSVRSFSMKSSHHHKHNQVFQRARSIIWNTLRKKPFSSSKKYVFEPSQNSLYEISHFSQISAVKEVTSWIKIFQFFMSYPQIFGNLTSHRISKSSSTYTFAEKNNISMSNRCSYWNTPSNKKKAIIDTSKLEFAGSHDIIKTFESIGVNISLTNRSFSCINVLSN